MVENKTNELNIDSEEKEIDLMELFSHAWSERKLIIRVAMIAAAIGVIIAFSIPKEYLATTTLAPEVKEKGAGGNMAAFAAMAGIPLGNSSNEDALNPDLYPDIVGSTPFLTNLFHMGVKSKNGKINSTLYTYLKEDQRSAWWSSIISSPFKAIGWVTSLFADKDETGAASDAVNNFMLTNEQARIAKSLSKRIQVQMDKKSGKTTITVMMQDPLIAATITDSVMISLQEYITHYRTSKAEHDYKFTLKLYQEAKNNYYEAQQQYATYTDGNINVVKQRFLTESERLQNEMNLAFGIYNQLAQQVQITRTKIQDITPVYTVVQPSSVPLNPIKPKKAMIVIGFVFVGIVGALTWILFIKEFLKKFSLYRTKE